MAAITFTPTTWVDDTTPAITAAQLNRIEGALDDVINEGGDLDLGTNTLAAGKLQSGNGTAALPAIGPEGDPDSGIYSISADRLGISTGGTVRLDINATRASFSGVTQVRTVDGSVSTPSWSYDDDQNLGWYRYGADEMGLSCGGTQSGRINATRVRLPQIYNDTTANSGNVYVGSDGRLFRSTSALKYKTNVRSLDVGVLPRPVRYTSQIDESERIGFIADEVADMYPEAAIYGPDGEVEDYDVKALLACVVAAVSHDD